MAVILAFPGRPAPAAHSTTPPAPTSPAPLPSPFTPQWQSEHLPLVGQAMELLQADEAELQRRCRTMVDRGGRTLLEELSAQIDKLGSHVSEAAAVLSLAALRIRRTTMALPA